MRALMLSLALVLALPAAVLAGPKLWSTAEAGMSELTLRQLFPDAQDGSGDTIGTVKAVEKMRLPRQIVLEDPFTARFFFHEGGLHLLMLTHEAPETTSVESIQKFVDRYTEAYGEPKAYDAHPSLDIPGIVYRQFTWSGPDRKVTMVWVKAPGGTPIMNINFSTP